MISKLSYYFNTTYIKEKIADENLRASSVYLSSSILGTGVAFFLVPILTRYLTTHDYGIVANYTALFSLSNLLVSLGSSGYIFRNYFFLKHEEYLKSISNALYVNLFIASVTFFILLIINRIIFNVFEIPLKWLLLIPLLSVCQTVIDITLNLYQARKKAKKYAIFQVSQTIVNLGLSVIFVALFLWNWEGRIVALVISSLLMALTGIFILRKDRLINFSPKIIDIVNVKDFLKFGVPLIPHFIGGFVLSLSDRFFLSSMVSVSAAGLYSVGFTFGGLLMILHGAFYKVFLPYAFEHLSKSNDSFKIKRKLVKITYLYISCFILGSIGLYFVAKIIFPIFVGPKFK
ncbi:MAG: oligosaccharide flippase family protein, partial [Ignavibacteriaceae bacterium]